MQDNILVRAIGNEFEIYQFIENIEEFTEFYRANTDNFDIFEIANLKDLEITKINDEYSIYDMTLANTEEHFWLIKDENTGMYEPVDDKDQAEHIIATLSQNNT